MKSSVIALAALAAASALAGPAAAQRGVGITLYEGPNFQGASRSFGAGVDNLADQGFNDRAQSVRVQGVWRLCEDSRMRGRCVEVSGDVPNLADLRLTAAVSSFEPRGPAGFGNGAGNNFGGGGRFNGGQSLDGRTVSFFPNPPPGPYRNADDFCRGMGFSGVVYADDRGQLRDVVCRR